MTPRRRIWLFQSLFSAFTTGIRALRPRELTALRYKSRGEEALPLLYLALHSRRPGLVAITECHP